MGQSIFSDVNPVMPQGISSTAYKRDVNPVMPQGISSIAYKPPMQRMQQVSEIMKAVTNPAQFAKSQFPDIPDDIINNPQAILGYLQQTRGIGNAQLQQILQQYGR